MLPVPRNTSEFGLFCQIKVKYARDFYEYGVSKKIKQKTIWDHIKQFFLVLHHMHLPCLKHISKLGIIRTFDKVAS